MPSSNVRYANYRERTRQRQRLLREQNFCALCGREIDKTLKTPHPMSAEVDEIIPVSKGGSPIDPSNLQLVHRCCNIRKGNKVAAENKKINNLPMPTSREWF